MFASQLLRILQTVPSDVKYESCVLFEQDMTMKESLNATLYGSNYGSKEIYPLNGLTNETVLEGNERDENWNPKFLDVQSGTRNSTEKEFQNVLFYPPSSPSEDTNPKDKESVGPEHEHLIETDTNSYADKSVLECDTPELMACYRDINYHVVKDICVDEWTLVNGKIPIEDVDNRCEAVEGAFDMENFTKCVITANEPETTKSPSESSSDEDITEDLVQKGETNCGAHDETVSDGLEEDSFVDRALPIQEFGTRSFLRSFIDSLDGEGTKVVQLPDQVSSGKSVTAGPAASSAEPAPKDDASSSSLSYNSKVESKNITFNFNSLAPVVAGDTNGKIENDKEQSVDSKDTSNKNVLDQSLDHKDNDSHDLSSDGLVQFANGNRVNSVDSDDNQGVDSNVLKVDNNDTVISREKYELGESSFSAAGLVSYSGPIGSISFRSDGSATSGRSFAFPILQSEWNSSPVRMTKANERHFRKHKFWRSGLLCCRF